MMRRMFAVLAAVVTLALPGLAAAQPADLPSAGDEIYAPFAPMLGKTWRGIGTGPERPEDIQRWEWAVGGHAIRVTHAVNGGVYGGETLIFRDKDSGEYIFHYFTSGGFHTTGTIRASAPGVFAIEEAVHGVENLEALRSSGTMGEDGVYRVRASVERNGAWVEAGGFDYREDSSATVVMPVRAQGAREAPASAGPLDVSRRIVRGVDQPGEAVAGYLLIRNGSPVADELTGARCDCASRVEFHQIRRSEGDVSMDSEASWEVPPGGVLEVRPGSDLHLMLIGYDPAKAVNGKISMTLTFRDAGQVTADFDLVEDSRAAWAEFD
ncbi:copper chaperone PCu(A)C [Brevundimonas lenta]|uniref:Copper(I)-binding protein n=1 Tax=Brevundimonas lenta TaxID=424796 RepID=A0A7W6JGU2_9CAUL|nr:copper chaperone PCu(A)C [Brevundimonas lenta]MBB4083908.1 copper(I)-binding protein [Brevundimonas lenta]